MVFQVFHSFPARDTAWGTSLLPLPPEPSVSTRCVCPRCPAWRWACPGSHPPLQAVPQSSQALTVGNMALPCSASRPCRLYLRVSASLVKTAASSSASSSPRGFTRYRTKCHALFPPLVLLVRHKNVPHHHPRQLSLWTPCRKDCQKPHSHWFLATLPTRLLTGSDKSESQPQFRALDSFTCQFLDLANMFPQPVT